ncbi:MAG: LLM class flavin-dependent oxidoreductase, partial [Eggerthellaceae bacterium]|nr:LLM class flavin-dependent oxidoreductase [Eggerthellaceae bacterium]
MNYSVLDLVSLREGQTYKEAYDDQLALARAVEGFGYKRYWIAEHHNSKRIGSIATQLLIQRVLAATDHMRVGSGGVMLPNHSPYIVAEQYGTLETLYPGRVDLGLGRAPGTDMKTAMAIRRTNQLYPDFERDVTELVSYFEDTAAVHAYPAAGMDIPLYILGSSTESAYFAAKMGLPYSFAAHFAPADMEAAIQIYRSLFNPSKHLDAPYVILGINATLAETDAAAERLATTQLQSVLGILNETQQG